MKRLKAYEPWMGRVIYLLHFREIMGAHGCTDGSDMASLGA